MLLTKKGELVPINDKEVKIEMAIPTMDEPSYAEQAFNWLMQTEELKAEE